MSQTGSVTMGELESPKMLPASDTTQVGIFDRHTTIPDTSDTSVLGLHEIDLRDDAAHASREAPPSLEPDSPEQPVSPQTPPTLREPDLIARRYRIREPLGSGQFADVFTAYDELLQRSVALKIFHQGRDNSVDAERYRSEIRPLARLSHPQLVQMYDAGVDDQGPWCVVRYVAGGSLADQVTPMPPAIVGRIGQHIAQALDYLHENSILHKNIQLSNILLDDDKDAYLSDAGISTIAGHTGFDAENHDKVAYCSPEQVTGQTLTSASDIYSLALVLLECLTGNREYQGSARTAGMARLSRSPQIPMWLGTEWINLLTAMTSTDPLIRPTAANVAERLRAVDDTVDHETAAALRHDLAGGAEANSVAPDPVRPPTMFRPAPQWERAPLPVETDEPESPRRALWIHSSLVRYGLITAVSIGLITLFLGPLQQLWRGNSAQDSTIATDHTARGDGSISKDTGAGGTGQSTNAPTGLPGAPAVPVIVKVGPDGKTSTSVVIVDQSNGDTSTVPYVPGDPRVPVVPPAPGTFGGSVPPGTNTTDPGVSPPGSVAPPSSPPTSQEPPPTSTPAPASSAASPSVTPSSPAPAGGGGNGHRSIPPGRV